MTKTVYWSPVITGDDWPLISELKYYEPERLLKRIKPVEFFGPATAKCPAMVDELKNTFAIKSPIDLHIDFGKDFDNPVCHNGYPLDALAEIIDPPMPERIFQLHAASILLFCEEELTVTQLHPYYEDSSFTENVMGISGTLDISSWLRPVQPGFKFKKDRHILDIKDGEVVSYFKFNTTDTVVLKRFDGTDLYKKEHSIAKHCVSYKNFKPNSHTQTLETCYHAFKEAKFDKRVIKYIQDNLLE